MKDDLRCPDSVELRCHAIRALLVAKMMLHLHTTLIHDRTLNSAGLTSVSSTSFLSFSCKISLSLIAFSSNRGERTCIPLANDRQADLFHMRCSLILPTFVLEQSPCHDPTTWHHRIPLPCFHLDYSLMPPALNVCLHPQTDTTIAQIRRKLADICR